MKNFAQRPSNNNRLLTLENKARNFRNRLEKLEKKNHIFEMDEMRKRISSLERIIKEMDDELYQLKNGGK